MRDVIAGLLALLLLLAAASLASTLQYHRLRRRRAREALQSLGRTVIAELPAGDDLVLFAEDASGFYYGDRGVAKNDIVAARVLINGAPIAAVTSKRLVPDARRQPTSFEDHPEGIARDRWDVAIETADTTLLVECGAIRERVSQELARTVFDAVRRDIETRDGR